MLIEKKINSVIFNKVIDRKVVVFINNFKTIDKFTNKEKIFAFTKSVILKNTTLEGMLKFPLKIMTYENISQFDPSLELKKKIILVKVGRHIFLIRYLIFSVEEISYLLINRFSLSIYILKFVHNKTSVNK